MPTDNQVPQPSRPKNRAAAELGRRGGMKGGAARAANMTEEERKEAAREAARARWARVAYQQTQSNAPPDDAADEEEQRSGRTPKPFAFTLTQEEAAAIADARGSGGFQTLHRRLVSELARGDRTILFTDAQLGELIRCMTRYGRGTFQTRLRIAFGRPLKELLELE